VTSLAHVHATVDPSTGRRIASFSAMGWTEVDAILDRARTAQRSWAADPVGDRVQVVHALASVLRERRRRLASLLTLEMGKPIRQAFAEVDKSAHAIEQLADLAAEALAPIPIATEATRSEVRLQPLGTVFAVMPWNYPLWQVLRSTLPAVLAGNAVVLKHAPNVPQAALAIEELLLEAGLPRGVFSTLLIDTDLAARTIADPRVAAVTLTGSVGAGQAVGALAGRHLKPMVLELGGSDPFVVLADADIPAAAAAACRARFQNNGQSCVAAKRFIVVEEVADEFLSHFIAAVDGLRVGDPTDPATDIGPLARDDLRATLIDQRDRSVALGARIATAERRLPTDGWYFAPTVLVDVTPEMPIFAEETFGPLTGVRRVADEAEAIALANASPFGLGCSLWSADAEHAASLADEIEAGMVFVNAIVASDARLPFGGVKESGIGRELSTFGIREFVNVQTVWRT
jgi:succinate-semialdehyde dehydrogenase/glutarate-semialdehyde dehydrogenase